MLKRIILPLIVLFINSCLSLDPFLFHEESISEYKMYEYDGPMECDDAVSFLDENGFPRAITKEVSFYSGEEKIYGIWATMDSLLSPDDTVILYLHGTSDHIDYVWPRVALLAAIEYPVFAIDYKGYGKSEGVPTEDGLNEDGFSALSYLRDSVGVANIIVYAYSLGTLVGGELAIKDTNLLQLIFEAPIGSVETLVEDAAYINIPGSYVTTFSGNNIKRIKDIKIPYLWLHGEDDETLYIETNGRPIWNNYNGIRGYGATIPGAGHKTTPSTLGYGRYLEMLKDFIQNRENIDPIFFIK